MGFSLPNVLKSYRKLTFLLFGYVNVEFDPLEDILEAIGLVYSVERFSKHSANWKRDISY